MGQWFALVPCNKKVVGLYPMTKKINVRLIGQFKLYECCVSLYWTGEPVQSLPCMLTAGDRHHEYKIRDKECFYVWISAG